MLTSFSSKSGSPTKAVILDAKDSPSVCKLHHLIHGVVSILCDVIQGGNFRHATNRRCRVVSGSPGITLQSLK